MCDLTPLRNWLIAILLTISAAAGTVLLAKVANAYPATAGGAPFLMVLAAVLSGTAVVFCSLAIEALKIFCKCTGPGCSGPCDSLQKVLIGASIVTGILGLACLDIALFAWIPWLPQVPMTIIIGAFWFQGFLVVTAVILVIMLILCRPAGPPPSP